MNSKVLHDMRGRPYQERETFNNAILLLSMVKSEYYYIIGFSRPDNMIEIGFDFEDKLHDPCTEVLTMEFSSVTDKIKVHGQLSNVVFDGETAVPFDWNPAFSVKDGYVYYDACFDMDEIVPVSMEKLNVMILSVKKDLEGFMDASIDYLLSRRS